MFIAAVSRAHHPIVAWERSALGQEARAVGLAPPGLEIGDMPMAAADENREAGPLPREALLQVHNPLAFALSDHTHLAAADDVAGMAWRVINLKLFALGDDDDVCGASRRGLRQSQQGYGRHSISLNHDVSLLLAVMWQRYWGQGDAA
jgi:hypothetical protein